MTSAARFLQCMAIDISDCFKVTGGIAASLPDSLTVLLSVIHVAYAVGGMTTFNVLFGYEEAMLRGFRLGFLTDQEYHHVC